MPDPQAEITAEFIRQAPGLAAALIIVILFLKAQSDRDKAWREFLEAERKSRELDTARVMGLLDKLVSGCGAMHTDLQQIDTFLRTSINSMQTRMLTGDTTPLRRRKDDPK